MGARSATGRRAVSWLVLPMVMALSSGRAPAEAPAPSPPESASTDGTEPAEASEREDDGETPANVTSRSGLQGQAQFGAHNTVGGQIASDDRFALPLIPDARVQRALQPYFTFKRRVHDGIGLAFGADYNLLAQGANESPGERGGVSGAARLFGQWNLFGRGTPHNGALVFKGENRHAIGTAIAPAGLAAELGYAGLTATTFNDGQWQLTNLYWQQHLNDDRLSLIVGVVDGTDYIDVYALVNPWSDFSNYAFLNSPTIPIPSAGLGAAARVRPSDRTYVLVGFADRNGDPSRPAQSFERLFTRGEVIVHAELGWVPTWERRMTDGVHLTGWYATARDEPATPAGWGLAGSWSRRFEDRFEAFARGGYSQGAAALQSGNVSVGLGVRLRAGSDQLGIGVGWGRPNADEFSGRRNQATFEIYYRLKLLQNFDLTPDVQVLVRPAENPDQAAIAVLGLRGRLKF